MIAIYIEKVYERKLFDSIGEAEFREDDYRKLFEFSADDNVDRPLKPLQLSPGLRDGSDEGGATHDEELAAWRAGLKPACDHRRDEQQEDNAFFR